MCSEQTSIAFFFPYRNIGGVSVLFLRLATLVSKKHKVTLIDYDDGYMAQRVPEGVLLLTLDKIHLLDPNSIIVFQSTPLWRIELLNRIPSTCRIFMWNLHPSNFTGALLPLKRGGLIRRLINIFSHYRREKLTSFVQYLSSKNAIAFMDTENLSVTESSLDTEIINAKLLPLITDDIPLGFHCQKDSCLSNSEPLKALWVGRLESFKIPVLKRLFCDLGECSNVSVSVKLIGSGSEKAEFIEYLAQLPYQFDVEFFGDLEGPQLYKHIEEADIGFCMGTSALDLAKFGKPVVCMDYSYSIISKPVKYRLLSDVEGFTLARDLSRSNTLMGTDLEGILERLKLNYESESQRSFVYWYANHSPARIETVERSILESSAYLSDLMSARLHRPDIFTWLLNVLALLISRKSKSTNVYKL